MNVYAHKRDAFDEDGARIGELFAEPAAIAVQNAHVLAQAQRLAAQLQVAIANQATIDQAVGILMSRHGGDPEQAMDQLSQLSHEQHEKLHTVAFKIVQDAVQRASGGRNSDERDKP
jgi:AmiR/NasT family two-component response regulator